MVMVLIALTGCPSLSPPEKQHLAEEGGIASIGKINASSTGLSEIEDKTLLLTTLVASGKDILCAGKLYVSTSLFYCLSGLEQWKEPHPLRTIVTLGTTHEIEIA